MKQQIPPMYAVIAVVAILCIGVFIYWRIEQSSAPPVNATGQPSMPPEVAKELQKKLGSVQPR